MNSNFSRYFDMFTSFLFRWGAVSMIMCMTAVIAVDTIGRYIFSAPIDGSADIVSQLLLVLFLVLLPHSFRGDQHIRMDLFYVGFSKRPRRVVNLISALGTLLFASLLAIRAWANIDHHRQVGAGTQQLGIPLWPFDILIVVSCVLFAISVILSTASNILGETGDTNLD